MNNGMNREPFAEDESRASGSFGSLSMLAKGFKCILLGAV